MSQYLKYPVQCLMIYIGLVKVPVSNCRLFSDINISQGSVVTHLRCGGIYSQKFTANLLESLTMREF